MKPSTYIQKAGSVFMTSVISLGVFITSFSSVEASEVLIQASPWNTEKAIHLAHRALISPTLEDIQMLIDAGSAENAVEYLFRTPTASEKFYYEQDLDTFYDEGDFNNSNIAKESYVVQRWKNPEEAKEKLFLLFEDILTVDISKIMTSQQTSTKYLTYVDWHHTIYDSLDGSYKELIKKTMRETAPAHYLNLLNGNKNSPNQDFAREFLQLFLMEERGPFETDINVRNYTEQEMINMSFLITGYRQSGSFTLPTSIKNAALASSNRYLTFTKLNGSDSAVWFDRAQHNTTPRELFGEMVSTPVGQDPAEIITEYVFNKKKDAIADFIGWKLINHYVNTTPTPAEIQIASQILKDNDFHILNSAKALLKHDIMYSSASMNEFRYKNPVELVVGMLQKFNPKFDSTKTYNQFLPFLDFVAIGAPTIFGRDGMDKNDLWMDSSKYGSWVSFIAYSLPETLLNLPCTEDFENKCISPSKDSLKKQAGENDSAYVTRIWNFVNAGKPLNTTVKAYFETIVASIEGGQMTDQELYTLLGDLFSQPEYMLLSGDTLNPETNNGNVFPNDHVVIYHWLAGAPDIQHLFPPVHDKNYELIKGKLAVTPENQVDLIDKNGDVNELYRANKYAFGEKMLGYYRSGELSIINGAGLIGQSQSHEAARTQTETGTLGGAIGYLTRVFEDSPIPATQIQKRAFSQLMNGMASSSIPFTNVSTGLQTDASKNLSSLFPNRTLPGKMNSVISDSLSIASLVESKGLNLDNLQGRFNYFLELIGSQNALIMTDAAGSFDSHRDQAPYLAGRTADGSTRVAGNKGFEERFRSSMDLYSETFESFKTKYPNKEFTIVMYGEFGRTTVPNATLGTDHGRGGLFLLLSTDNTLMQDDQGNDLPQMIGRLNTGDNQLNYQDVKVDKRSIWNHLFEHVYNKNIFTSAGEENPLPLSQYAKMDSLYDELYKAQNFDDQALQNALSQVKTLKTELTENTFATNFFLGRLEEINNHFARSLSLPKNHEHLFSSFSFENNIGDSSYHAQALKPTGELVIDYANGFSGQGLLLEPGEQYDNDKYDIYTKELAKNPDISAQKGNSIFFSLSPETIASNNTVIFENLGKGARVSLSNIGQNGGKKLVVDYINGNSVSAVLPASSQQSPELHVGEWAHIGIVSDITAKKFIIYINGKAVASKSNPPSFGDNYKYRFGSTNSSAGKHSVIIDEFSSYGKAYTADEAKLKYVLDSLKNPANKDTLTQYIQNIPDNNEKKSQFMVLLENIDRPEIPKNKGSFLGSKVLYENINQCLESGSGNIINGEIKLKWKEENLFINESFFRQSISPVFLQGLEDGSIDFTYDKPSKTYTFRFNGNDEELWSCYFQESAFFIKFFTFVE